MAKFTNDAVMDAALGFVQSNASRLVVLSSLPATYAAVAAATLAEVAVASGDFTLGNGTPSGRQYSIAQKANVPITASGSAVNVGLVDDTNSRILDVTSCTSLALTSGGTVTIPAWTHTITDPT